MSWLLAVMSTVIGLGAGAAVSYVKDAQVARTQRRTHWQDVRILLYTRFLVAANEAERARGRDALRAEDDGRFTQSNAQVESLYVMSEELHLIAGARVLEAGRALRDSLGPETWELAQGNDKASGKSPEFVQGRNVAYRNCRRAFIAAARAEAGVED